MNNLIDLKGLTILHYVRIDTEERAKNIKIITAFYRKTYNNYSVIYIEDDKTKKLPDIINFHENELYIFRYNPGMWNKCWAFNNGIVLAKSNIIAFHDIDVIVSPDQLLETITCLEEDKNAGLIYPYNGMFLCVAEAIKNEFATTLTISTFDKYFPENTTVNYDDGNVLVGHVSSVGGLVLGRRDNLIKAHGYNPNFIGWGYEDNELPARVHRLGFNVTRLNGNKKPLWHMPHGGPGASPKADNPNYDRNGQILNYVSSLTKDKLEEYINNWSIL